MAEEEEKKESRSSGSSGLLGFAVTLPFAVAAVGGGFPAAVAAAVVSSLLYTGGTFNGKEPLKENLTKGSACSGLLMTGLGSLVGLGIPAAIGSIVAGVGLSAIGEFVSPECDCETHKKRKKHRHHYQGVQDDDGWEIKRRRTPRQKKEKSAEEILVDLMME